MPFIAIYESKDPKRLMLGGVRASKTSRFESKKDAELRLTGIVDVHAKLERPLEITGQVVEVGGSIEIFDDGSCLGCLWGKALAARKKAK